MFYLTMGEHIFSRAFGFRVMQQRKKVTFVDSLPKRPLSEAVWKIRDSFPPAAGSLTFDEPLNFPLWINSVGPERNQSSTRSPPSRSFFSVSDTNRRTTRRRDFDLAKSSGQLSSPERVDNAGISRDFLADEVARRIASVALILINFDSRECRAKYRAIVSARVFASVVPTKMIPPPPPLPTASKEAVSIIHLYIILYTNVLSIFL